MTTDQMCDGKEAVRWWKAIESDYPEGTRKTLDIEIYGKTIRQAFPISGVTLAVSLDTGTLAKSESNPPQKEEWKDVTDDLYNYIAQQTKRSKLSDNLF